MLSCRFARSKSKLDWTKHAARDICRPVDAPNVHLLISLQGFRPSGCFPSLFFRSTKPNRYKSILPIHQWWFKHVDGSNLDNYSNMVYSLKKSQCTQWLRGDSYHVQICGSLLEVFNQRFAEVGQRYRQVIEVTNVSLTFNQLLGLGHDSRSSQDMRCFQLFFFGMSKCNGQQQTN